MTRRIVLAAAAAAALALSSAAGAADGWRTYGDPGGGFAIAVPARWRLVPRSDRDLAALVVRLRKRREPALAAQYAAIAAARARLHTAFRFQAFQWPAPPGPIVPDVSVKIDRLASPATKTTLAALARQYEQALGRARGATVRPAVDLTLAAGPAVRIAGTTPLGRSTVRSGYVVYLLVRGTRLYSISFRAAAPRVTADAALFARIAGTFRFA